MPDTTKLEAAQGPVSELSATLEPKLPVIWAEKDENCNDVIIYIPQFREIDPYFFEHRISREEALRLIGELRIATDEDIGF